MGALILALEMAKEYLWDPLTNAERSQVLAWIRSVRGAGLHRNNHLFFGVVPLSFLLSKGIGTKEDAGLVLHWMDVLESMALGGGWFVDGMNETVDHYNAYAFHYYGLWWGKLYGDLDPARAERWRSWTAEFLPDYAHFFAASGENVPYGRSLTYRFAASAPFGLAHHCGVRTLSAGLSRRLCTRNLHFFTSRLPADQPLSLGWTDSFPALAEAYSCAGSPYWAAKAFAPLLIERADPFWHAPEEPLPAETGDFVRPISQAGVLVRSVGGAVELINTDSGICPGNTAFGTYKWGKISFRTGVGFDVQPPGGPWPQDAALTAEFENGAVFGRHSTHPLKCTDDEAAMVYQLGDKRSLLSVQVETRIHWRGGWQLQVHKVTAQNRARLTAGGYSLASDAAEKLTGSSEDLWGTVSNGVQFAALQGIRGWKDSVLTRHGRATERTHMVAPESLCPQLRTDWFEGEQVLICLSYCGEEEPAPWTVDFENGISLRLLNDAGDAWEVVYA
jgi:hypothetical protein